MVDNEVRIKLLKELRETNFAAYTTKYGEKAGFFFAAALPRECHILELEKEKDAYKKLLSKARGIIKILKDDLSMYSGGYQKEIEEAEEFLSISEILTK